MGSRSRRSFAGVAVLALVGMGCAGAQAPAGREADLRAASCLGPKSAKAFAVYLHGIDSPSVSEQELGARARLARIADALSMRIALPRATSSCPSQRGARCWGWAFEAAELDAAASLIQSSAHACFGDQPFGLIGFSNGGYLLSKLFRTCLTAEKVPRAQWIVTVGAGMLRGPLEPAPETLAGCGRMILLSGYDDAHNTDPDDRLFHALRAKSADVESVRFEGGHLVPEGPLKRTLQKLVR